MHCSSRRTAAIGVASLLSLLLLPRPVAALSFRNLATPDGPAGLAQLGFSVDSAGDFNGDGYSDFIVGANSTANGNAYIYFGGPGADDTPDLTLTGEAVGDQFGASVAGVGDVNGDGFDDVLVGAPFNDAVAANAGRAYVFLGGASPNSVADVTLSGLTLSDSFGNAVAPAGDFNGDGFADVIVGAPFFGAADDGRAYIYLGGSFMNNGIDLTLVGAGGESLGRRLAGGQDVNLDGYDDVLVGCPLDDTIGVNAGRALLFLGGSTPNAANDLVLSSEAAGDNFGDAVGLVGDMNGDGAPDLAVGAPVHGAVSGRAYVFLGGGVLDATIDLTISGTGVSELGSAIDGAGDVNGDGFDDLAVAAVNGGFSAAGQVFVYLGSASLNATADLTIPGAAAADAFGYSVAGAGDVDGDGYADLVVGAPVSDAFATNAGRASVVAIYPYQLVSPNGGETWTAGATAAVQWRGHDPADIGLSLDGGLTFATVLSGVGGDEDNVVEVAVPTTTTTTARVRVSQTGVTVRRSTSDVSAASFFIAAEEPVRPVAIRPALAVAGGTNADQLGYSVAGAGDVNGDGYADWIVGIPFSDALAANAGQARVYFGGPAADNVADLTINGTVAADNLGTAVGAAGDFNGDHYDDFFVSVPYFDSSLIDIGRLQLFFGGPGVDAVVDLQIQSGSAGDLFGLAAHGAGDVNGDGLDDIIVGSPGYSAFSGRAYLLYGTPTVSGFTSTTLLGQVAGETFGNSVGGGGDYNGDGVPDVIVGAPLADGTAGVDLGRAYVFYGRAGGPIDATPDVVMTGVKAGDTYGTSVTDAGDLNGDGQGDLAVGSPSYDNGSILNAGHVDIYFGGSAFDNIPDFFVDGLVTNDLLGKDVAGAGDLNRDGRDDLLVGVPGKVFGNGRVNVYFGSPLMRGTPDLELDGAGAEQFGTAVAGAGDVFGDGFPDLLVGVPLNDATPSDAGRAALFDVNRYFLTNPNLPTTWNVGATQTIQWLGAEPADLFLSVDGGATYQFLATGGGSEANGVPIRVPHLPTRFARIKVAASDASLFGADASDSLFTIRTSVTLLSLAAIPLESGLMISWSTDPAVGPEGLLGYRLFRTQPGSSAEEPVGPDLLSEAQYRDATGQPGARYRLIAVNGLHEDLEVGQLATTPPLHGLSAWPSPARAGGALHLLFPVPKVLVPAVGGAQPAPATDVEVALFDVRGRRVRTLGQQELALQGDAYAVDWDTRLDSGEQAQSGVYWVRVTAPSAGVSWRQKVVLVR